MAAKLPLPQPGSSPARFGSPSFPAAESHENPDSIGSLDQALATLKAHKLAWAELPIRQRIHLLEEVQEVVR